MQKRVNISAIVPVFNEESTVAQVVHALIGNQSFCEIICVNDGSTDQSLKFLEDFGDAIELINFEENQGKGQALATGISRSKGEIVVFIDADLTNLTNAHLKALTEPLLEGEADAVLGYPRRGEIPNLTAELTGQRAYFRESLLPYLDQIAPSRFGVEVLLNDLFREKRVRMVPLQDLIGLTKVEKRNPLQAIVEYVNEGLEITKQLALMKVRVR